MPVAKVIYETDHFQLGIFDTVHVDREDGGHICIFTKGFHVSDRWQLSPEQAIELARLVMLSGEAYKTAMNNRNVPVERINFQDNGNWAYKKPHSQPFMHVHLYGRTRNSIHQVFGEALNFPAYESGFYDHFKPIDEGDIKEIQKQISVLETTDKYKIENWHQ